MPNCVKGLKKFIAMTMTYWFVDRKLAMAWAAVVDSVGWKANSSLNARVGGGVKMAGHRI